MRSSIRNTVFGLAALAVSSLLPATAAACGGFFCNQARPVNQAAEGIIFADNGDGTVTAVIQIQYQGPAKNFSWLLPISSVPKADTDIGIASNLAFQRLQAATNPNYTLTTRVEGTCRQSNLAFPSAAGGSGSASATGGAPGRADGSGVTVEASGVVGAFEWTVISLDKSTTNPADAAVAWLKDNAYDVPVAAPDLLAPYLEQGLYLLALKLTKGADSGSIRPIVLTYRGTQPSIPIKLTAVAANEDMGVLAWVLGASRAAPQNYFSLQLNEARINWFNAGSSYNSVVIEAANDAGGQGFVTEFADATTKLDEQVWTAFDQQAWASFKGSAYQSFGALFTAAYATYGGWDGFWDATRSSVTLPDGVSFENFKLCPNCYAADVKLAPASYIDALQTTVIEPVKRVQDLIDAHPQITRMYTTLSAEEMTLDPLFGFNPDLPAVDNQHTAARVIECNPNVYDYEASWRIELPQGFVIHGAAADAQTRTWPSGLGSLPSNRLIVQTSQSGTGKVVKDNSTAISSMLTSYNANVPSTATDASGGSGCSVHGGRAPWTAFVVAAALGAVVIRRRRR